MATMRHGIHLGVGQAGDEVGGAGSAGGHADADLAGAAGVALGGETAALLVARQDGAQSRSAPASAPGEWACWRRRDRRRRLRHRDSASTEPGSSLRIAVSHASRPLSKNLRRVRVSRISRSLTVYYTYMGCYVQGDGVCRSLLESCTVGAGFPRPDVPRAGKPRPWHIRAGRTPPVAHQGGETPPLPEPKRHPRRRCGRSFI